MVTVSTTQATLTNRPLRPHDDLSYHPLLQELLEAAPDIILVLNDQRHVVFANRATLEWLGLRPDELLSCSVNSGQGCRITRSDGSELDVHVQVRPLLLDHQRFTVFAVQDISREKRRRALERTFFHDVLNTAGLLQGYTELLDHAAPTEIPWLRERISHLSERLVEEIRSQRAVTAAEDNELVAMPEPLDSATLLQEIARIYEWNAVNWKIELVIHDNVQSVNFCSDMVLLKRVIGNMVKNALEASQTGDTVTLMAAAMGEHVVFSVHNPAVMPRNVQLQLFERSFSTKGRGRGLGTYSMKLLTEQYLNGELWFTSAPNAGTTFYARYPLAWVE
jgi:signal transduction histidine kinase